METITEKIVIGIDVIAIYLCYLPTSGTGKKVAEGEGFEPPVALRLRLISSQVPSTTQPPFRSCGS